MSVCDDFYNLWTRHVKVISPGSSRAVQISMNLSILEEWIGDMQLPRGVGSHFAPVKDLLNWLQVGSSLWPVLHYANFSSVPIFDH